MKNIRRVFENRKSKPIGKFRKSAVMILLLEEENELYVVFEKRAFNLRKQPGDVSLPGGAIEEGETPKEAAIRETEEELNIYRKDIEFIGEMDYFISSYNSIIFPFIGKIKNTHIQANKDEVDHVFKVPLKFFLNTRPIHHEVEIKQHFKEDFPFHLIEGGKKYKFSTKKFNRYFYIYEEYVIWGFTAKIIKSFIELIK